MEKLSTMQFKRRLKAEPGLWIQNTDLSEVDFEGLWINNMIFEDCIVSPEQISKAIFSNIRFKRMSTGRWITVGLLADDRTDLEPIVRGGTISLIFGLYMNLDDLFRLTELVDIDSL